MNRFALLLTLPLVSCFAQEFGREITAGPVTVLVLKYSDKLPGVPGGEPASERTGIQVLVRTNDAESPIKQFLVRVKSRPSEGDEIVEAVTGDKAPDVEGRPTYSVFTFWTEGRAISGISVEPLPGSEVIDVPLDAVPPAG
jgi:hypothetical protein